MKDNKQVSLLYQIYRTDIISYLKQFKVGKQLVATRGGALFEKWLFVEGIVTVIKSFEEESRHEPGEKAIPDGPSQASQGGSRGRPNKNAMRYLKLQLKQFLKT